jgi:Aspartyl protease
LPLVSATPFEYLHHLVTVRVVVDGVEARFVLDTGIGLTLVGAPLAEALGVAPSGSSYTGRRMSGQDVTLPLTAVGSLSLGSLTRERHPVGILDREGFPDELAGIGGFLSLAFFEEAPFTVDYAAGVVVVETAESLEARVAAGAAVDVRVRRDGPAVDVFLPFTVPGRGSIEVEVDMGSDSLILDERLAADVGVRLDDPAVRAVEGQDETGRAYGRYFTAIDGDVHPSGAPDYRQARPDVMFQRIVHDGLVGDAFLRNFVVTFDVAGARMLFARPA